MKSSRTTNLDSSGVSKIEPSMRGPGTSALARMGTGPRTRIGKEKSSYNALAHGIFSKVAVLKGESQAEFDAQLNGLRKDFRPAGRLEETLVQLLAVTLWRLRRAFIAETAEIEAATELLEGDEKESLEVEERLSRPPRCEEGELIRRIGNPVALEKCLDLLTTLKVRIEAKGLDAEKDKDILIRLYGAFDEDQSEYNLFTAYSTWPMIANTHGQLPSPEECRIHFLEILANEIKGLVHYQEQQASIESARMKLESRRRNVPDSPRLYQLIRYSTNIERTFDRTLTQLERAQRMRRGQPVAPQLDVKISSS
jgi:hypothetical protein